MTLGNCQGCKQPMDHDVKMVNYYLNGKPQYSRFCKACIKSYYERLRDFFGLKKDDQVPVLTDEEKNLLKANEKPPKKLWEDL